MTLTRSAAIAGSVAVALLTTLLATPAEADFSRPRAVTPTGWNAGNPVQATDRQGDSTFVWVAGQGGTPEVQARVRKADGTLTPVRTVTTIPDYYDVLDVAVDDDGDGVVVWDAPYRPGTSQESMRLYARRITRSGGLGAVHQVSPSSQQSVEAHVAVQPGGRGIITWSDVDAYGSGAYRPWVRTIGLGGGLGPVRRVGPGPDAAAPLTVIERSGRSLLLGSNSSHLWVRRVLRDGSLGARHHVYSDPDGENLHIVGAGMDHDGGALLVWQEPTPDEYRQQVRARRLSPSLEPRGRVRMLSRPGHDAVAAVMDSDRQGDAVVSWHVNYFAGAFARQVRHDGQLSAVTKLSDGGFGAVAVDDDGDGVIASTAYRNGLRKVIRLTRVRRDGTFGATVTAGVNDYDTSYLTAGTDRAGRATVAWAQVPDGDARILAVVGR